MRILRRTKKYLPIVCLLLLALVNQISCKKLDNISTGQSIVQNDKFFSFSANTSPVIIRVLEEMKKRNSKNEFILKFAKENGNPIWDKAMIFKSPHTNNNIATSGTIDTIVYIPFVLENAPSVNGYICAIVSDSIGLNYSLAQDYKAYPFVTNNNEMSATKFAFNMLMLNHKVFGTTGYKITDHKLFSTDTSHQKINKIVLGNNTSSQSFLSSECRQVTAFGYVCGTPYALACKPNCDYSNCSTGQCYSVTISYTYCWEYEDGEGLPGPFNPGDGGGAGGPNEPPIPHYYPCEPTNGIAGKTPQTGSNYNAPAGCNAPGPGTGWEPEPLDTKNHESWNTDAPFDKLCLNSFNFIGGNQNSYWETNLKNLQFEDNAGNINNFSAYYNLPNDITDAAMNSIIYSSPFGSGVPPKSALDYCHDFFPLLFTTEDIKRVWDPTTGAYVWRFSKYAAQLFSSKCSNIAATGASLQYPGTCANPGFIPAQNAFRTQANSLLRCFLPGAVCRLTPSTSSNNSFATYSPTCN